MARRSRGTGSLSVRKDARGIASWYGQWWVGERRVTRALGRKREPGTRIGLTRAQAERELQRQIDQDLSVPLQRELSVGEAGERLLDHLRALGRKRSTLGDYESFLRVHLAPYFGETALERIGRAEVEGFIAAKRREGKATEERPQLPRAAAFDLRLRGAARPGAGKSGEAGRQAAGRRRRSGHPLPGRGRARRPARRGSR